MELCALIEALSLPSAYPHGAAAVEVRQTHISVVFLAGDLAYKIKKPVALGFVDYSTPERRHQFCEEEVRLNRRLAPEVYLGIVPVTQDSGAIRMEGKGEVIDWAVKMKRLPDSATLRGRLAAGDIEVGSVEELARLLARFHATAEGGPQVSARCSLAAVARNARDNISESASQVGITVSRSTLERLAARIEVALVQLGGLIEDRARRGLPRDTHGDLRLDHVYFFPDRQPPGDWIVVDCIEFDPRFRHADPIADIAFLAMDLALEGRPDLSRAFVEEYLRASGDAEGRALLPFYQSYRSAVRGKVEGMKLAEPEIPAADREVARSRARACWIYALCELEEPRQRPCLVLVAGLPGAGKSSLSRQLARSSGFTLICSDLVRKELAAASGELSPAASFGAGLYSSAWNDRTYAECLRRAEADLFEGRRVLIDASFREDRRRRHVIEAARRYGVTASLLICQADPNVIRQRLHQRRGDASDADWAVYQAAARLWDPPSPQTRAAAHFIDTGGTEAESLAQAHEALRHCGLLEGDDRPAGGRYN